MNRDKACWNPEGEINSETDVYIWINTNDGDKEMGCIESGTNKVRIRKKCGWSIILQNIETGDEIMLDESKRELRTHTGGAPASCLSDGTQNHWHRFGPVNLPAGHYEVAYENVGGSHAKWFVGPNVQSSKPLQDCTAPFPTFKQQRYRAATQKDATFIGKFEQKRPNNGGSDWAFLYKVPLDIGDNTPKNSHVKDACGELDLKPLCSIATDARIVDSPCTYMQQDLTGNNIFWHKIFDGECGGAEVRMYEGAADNPGTDSASRSKACAEACMARKEPAGTGAGSWTGFDAVGFTVWDNGDATNDGRCFCESPSSKTCTRISNNYDRYDFIDWSNPTLFDSLSWNNAGDEIASKFYGSVIYAAGNDGITRYNDGITTHQWTPSSKRGGSTICYSPTALSTRGEFYVDNVFTIPPSSAADNCVTMEHYDTAGDDVTMLFGLCVDESEYHPVETVELGGLEVGTKHTVVVGAEAASISPESRQFELWTGTSGPPGAMNIKQTESTGGSITLFWNNPPSDRGGLGDAGDFEFSIFASNGQRPVRGVPPAGVVDGAMVSLDAAVTSSFGRTFTDTWKGVSGWSLKSDDLVLSFDPATYAKDNTKFNSIDGQSFTVSKGYHMASITLSGISACDGSGTSNNDRDTGIKTPADVDGIVGKGNSWTIGGWIYKSVSAPANHWHLFTDNGGDSDATVTTNGHGDILTIDTNGNYMTSMGDRFLSGASEITYGEGDAANPWKWSTLSYGWHELTIRYDASTKNVRLFVDGLPEPGVGHTRTIHDDFYIRSFWGWGSVNANYKYNGAFGKTYAYSKALTNSDVLFNHQGIAPEYGLSSGPFGTLEQCEVPFRASDGTGMTLGDGSRRDAPGIDCTWLHANGERNSKEYWIKPQGSAPFKTYCDMETDGGGWTLVHQSFGSISSVVTSSGPPIHQETSTPASSKSGRVSDILIGKICNSQYRVTQTGHEDDSLFCRLEDPSSFKNDATTSKYCSVSGTDSYSDSPTAYVQKSSDAPGFDTSGFNGAIDIQDGSGSANKESSGTSCTANEGKCDSRVWCKSTIDSQEIKCERKNLLETFKSDGFGAFGLGRKDFNTIQRIKLVGTEMCTEIEKSTDPTLEYDVEMWVKSHAESPMRMINDKCFDATLDSLVQKYNCCKGGWCAGAHSLHTISKDSGLRGVGFRVGDASQWKAAGLSSGATSSNTDLDDIDYALYFSGSGVAYVYEKGIKIKRVGSYEANTRCSIIINRIGKVEYSVGGILLHTTTTAAAIAWPLHVDVSAFWDVGEGKTGQARLLDFHWVQKSGQPAKIGDGKRCARTGAWLFTSLASSMVGGMNLWMDGSTQGADVMQSVFTLEGTATDDAKYGYIGRLEYDAKPKDDTNAGGKNGNGRGTVCNDGWKIDKDDSEKQANANAKVACSIMGLSGGKYLGSTGEISYSGQSYQREKQTTFATTDLTTLPYLSCNGNETESGLGGLEACPGFDTGSCTGKIEDVVIECEHPENEPVPGYVASPIGGTWEAANEHCTQRGWQLCTMHDYCPEGTGKIPQQAKLGSLRSRQPLPVDSGTVRWAPVADVANEWIQVSGTTSDLCKSWIDQNSNMQMGPDLGFPSGEDGKTFRCCPCPDIKPGWTHVVTQWERSYSTRTKAPVFQNIYVDGVKLTKDNTKTTSTSPPKIEMPSHVTSSSTTNTIATNAKDTYTAVSGAKFATQFANSFDAPCGDKGRTVQVRVRSMRSGSKNLIEMCTAAYSDCYPYNEGGSNPNWTSKGTKARGFNIVLIDPTSGDVTKTGNFDTYAANSNDDALNKFLRQAPAESIVVASVFERSVPPSNRVAAKNNRGVSHSASILHRLTGGYIDDRVSGGIGSEADPASDCTQLRASGFTVSGAYWIKPLPNSPAIKLYCDLTTTTSANKDGGGWSLVYKIGGVSTMRTTSGFPNSDNSDTSGLVVDQISYANSAKLSDNYMRALCTDQFRVVQTDETGKSTGKTCLSTGKCSHDANIACETPGDCVLNPWYCRFSNIADYSDTGTSTKLCGSTYLQE